MAAMLKPSAEYNRRALIIEGLRAERSTMEIIQFFGYPRSTIYDVVIKYTLEQSNEDSVCQRGRVTRKNATLPQSLKGLISDDPGQSLRKLAIVDIGKSTMR